LASAGLLGGVVNGVDGIVGNLLPTSGDGNLLDGGLAGVLNTTLTDLTSVLGNLNGILNGLSTGVIHIPANEDGVSALLSAVVQLLRLVLGLVNQLVLLLNL
jgi:hypothetical protein